MKVLLSLENSTSGANTFELSTNSYRALGRSGDATITMVFNKGGDRLIDPSDLARAEVHLSRRGRGDGPSRQAQIGTYRRGRDILIDDGNVSSTHALFFLDEEGASVVDLLSTNGTFVNGERVNEAELRDGDVVHIGSARVKVRVES